MSPSPSLPWEVIERVIDHSANSAKTLKSFTLTCSDLYPRSTMLLLGRVKLEKRDQRFDLCAFLQTKPHLQSSIRSVSIPVHEFSPHPLLRMLSNLSEIDFRDISWSCLRRSPTFHPSVLAHCHQFGRHIHTLSLRGLHFSSLSAFSNVLLLLPRIESLSCRHLGLDHVKTDHVHQELITRRLSERLHLRTLTIGAGNTDIVLSLLREAARDKVVTIICEDLFDGDWSDINEVSESIVHEIGLISPWDQWVQLTSFIWKPQRGGNIGNQLKRAISVLRNLHPPKLREVTVDISFLSFLSLLFVDLPSSTPELRAELEKALTLFPQPTLLFSPFHQQINSRRHHSWTPLVERFFPALVERHAVRIDAEYSGNAGHDGRISTPIVTSADSRWAATASYDGTIIVWDLQRGCISQEWLAEDIQPRSLAISPDGRYIASTGDRLDLRVTPMIKHDNVDKHQCAAVWDIHEGGRRVGSLKGERGGDRHPFNPSRNCTWSPDGTWIAAGVPSCGVTCIWETTTFQRLHPATTWKGSALLASSADGRWVVTAHHYYDLVWNRPTPVWIWSVESGELHRSFQGHTRGVCAAAFNLKSTHLATGSQDSTVRIWDAQTGEQLFVFPGRAESCIDAVTFSGDGRMVLSHSSKTSYYSADEDGSDAVRVWDASNGALLASLSETRLAGQRIIRSACFSPCGSYLVSVSDDKGALLWRTSDWSCIAEVSGSGAVVTHVAISPDGRVLCCGTEDGAVFFRRMHDLISANQN